MEIVCIFPMWVSPLINCRHMINPFCILSSIAVVFQPEIHRPIKIICLNFMGKCMSVENVYIKRSNINFMVSPSHHQSIELKITYFFTIFTFLLLWKYFESMEGDIIFIFLR